MLINDKTIEKLRGMNDPDVNELLEFYKFITEDQEYESYVARVVTLNKWNEDLSGSPISIITTQVGGLTVSDDGVKKDKDIEKEEAKRDKEVDRVLKFLEKQPALLDGTREMRASLTKQNLEDLKKDKRLKTSKDLAM